MMNWYNNNKNNNNNKPFTSIAPGRLCLFGEHQDYLGLPVVALALPLYCRIHVQPTPDKRLLELCIISSSSASANNNNNDDDHHQLATTETMIFDLDHLPPRQKTQDSAAGSDAAAVAAAEPNFALAALHEAVDSGWEFRRGGAICTSTCDFVMKAGLSSSSAFCVAWIQVLARLAGKEESPLELAQRAHQAEVTHFGAPGGTMDHVTSALGGLLRIGPGPWQVQSLVMSQENKDRFGVWVLAYSGEEKDTLGHLRRCKTARLGLLDKLHGSWDTADAESLDRLTADEQALLEATRTNRDTEREAVELWTNASAHNAETIGPQLGALMMRHHQSLRDGLELSTDRLEKLNEAAVQAGAWGFKVVGSGGGGCGVAWVSRDLAPKVAQAMKEAGAPITWIIDEPSTGARILNDGE